MFTQAESYQRYMGRWSRLLAPELVRFAGVRDGDFVLDVGSGTGSVASSLRDMFANVRVNGIDASDEFVRFSRQSVADPRIQFEVGDAQQLPFQNATFDVALSLLVLNFVPDSVRAVREILRVTKPKGVFAAAVWDLGPQGTQMLRMFWDEVITLDPAARSIDEATMSLCREGALAALCQQQGLQSVLASSLTVPLPFASFDDYWAPFLLGVGPAGKYVENLKPEHRDRLRARLQLRLFGTRVDRPFELQARAWAVKGTIPS
jgi:SAM-dependent methyltransferase